MSIRRVVSFLLMLLLSCCALAQTKSYPQLKGEASKARADVISAAKEYKESLVKLLALQQEDVRRAETEVEYRKGLLARKLIDEREVEWARVALSQAKAKVAETKSKLRGADKLIEEVQKESELAGQLSPNVIGPNAVWNPTSRIREELYSACSDLWESKPNELVDCVSSFLKKSGASPQAIAFSRLLGGKGFLISFKETGRVDIGDVYYFVRGNEPTGLVFLNGSPMIIDVEGPCCAAIEFVDEICDCPENTDKARRGYHPAFTSAIRSGNGQRFIIRDENRSCHACDIESRIYNAYDFDAAGKFLCAAFLYERAVETKRGQRRMKTN